MPAHAHSASHGAPPAAAVPTGAAGLLAQGLAFVDLSFWRKTEVAGEEALSWLDRLVSADVAGLQAGEARRSLLLSPTGRVRAEFCIGLADGRLLLVQDPAQPSSVESLLSPYVLSSAVELKDRTQEIALFAFPGLDDPPLPWRSSQDELVTLRPSCLGRGVGLLAPSRRLRELREEIGQRLVPAGNEDLEAWRIGIGAPRLGTDVTLDDLPQEAGLEAAVAFDKGCYLGQEAVAKVRNLGHPRRVVLALAAGGRVSPGDRVMSGGREVGEVTSAFLDPEGPSPVMARVRWDARLGPFETERGTPLVPRPVTPTTAR